MTVSVVRIGDLLREMGGGRWWPDDPAENKDAVIVLLHAHRIEESVWGIVRIVAAMKDGEANDA
jgi:hypothetical protein